MKISKCNTFYFFHRDSVEISINEASQKEMLGMTILVVVLVLSPVIIALVKNAVNTIQVFKIDA